MTQLTLQVLPNLFTIHRLPAGSEIPAVLLTGELLSITSTKDELSIVCEASIPVQAERATGGWSALKVEGPLDFGLTGILAGIATVLAEAGVSIFAISTYNTDYVLIQTVQLEAAIAALLAADYRVK
jgi:hypothetical protein